MRKLKGVTVRNLAGYREIAWPDLQPDENLLVGRNGAGKSTLLEAIVVGLNFLYGERSGDLLTGDNREASIRFLFTDNSEQQLDFAAIRAAQTPKRSRPVDNILYVHEGRRAKSRIGRGRNQLLQHPTRRYEHVLSELRELLHGTVEEKALAEHLLTSARELKHGGHLREWNWARQVLLRSGPNTRRPVSCGQYDVMALLLDVLRMERAVADHGLDRFVIVDNPEAFLHPALQQEMIDWLRRRLPEAQLFMSTHSLKLLARAAPASVYWLSREVSDDQGHTTVHAVRDLPPGDRQVFFELYGDDTSSAVLDLILGLESSEYLAFLCACVLPCQSVARLEPIERDVQLSLAPGLRPDPRRMKRYGVMLGQSRRTEVGFFLVRKSP